MNLMEHLSQKDLVSFCATHGKNPFLVQGAGGNISYKIDNSMFIKASGKSISNAKKVMVRLQNLFKYLASIIKVRLEFNHCFEV